VALLLAAAAEVSGHRRDEYLQAARLSIEPGAVQLQLDLTPGIALADAAVGDIDSNRDGTFSDNEQRAYAGAALKGLELHLDGRPISLELANAGFPSPDAIRRGEGTIRLEAAATLPGVPSGAHRLTLRNNHHPDDATYLANALVPQSQRVKVTGQLRDTDQRVLSVDYVLRPAPQAMSLSVEWIAGGLALAIAASVLLFTSLRSSP